MKLLKSYRGILSYKHKITAQYQKEVMMTKQNDPKISWCDLRCEHADFAKERDLDGSCRTFQALWCNKLEKHVAKNAPCEVFFGQRRPA